MDGFAGPRPQPGQGSRLPLPGIAELSTCSQKGATHSEYGLGNSGCAEEQGSCDRVGVDRAVASSAASVATPGTSVLAPVQKGGSLVRVRVKVCTRERPAGGSAIAGSHPEEGTMLQRVGPSSVDTEREVWYIVRNPETARVGWIRSTDVAPARQGAAQGDGAIDCDRPVCPLFTGHRRLSPRTDTPAGRRSRCRT